MSNVAIYVRTSVGGQESVSIDAQIARCRAYVEHRGLGDYTVFDDEGVSASLPLRKRPAGAEMVNQVEQEMVSHVVSLRLDRLFRDTLDCLANLTEWDTRGVAVHFVDLGGQSIDSKSALGRFALTTLAGVAQLERELISERTSEALRAKVSKGERVGAPPYGYAAVGDGTAWVPVAKEQAIVQMMVKMRRSGMSLNTLARNLNTLGIESKRGGKWHAATVSAVLDRADGSLEAA